MDSIRLPGTQRRRIYTIVDWHEVSNANSNLLKSSFLRSYQIHVERIRYTGGGVIKGRSEFDLVLFVVLKRKDMCSGMRRYPLCILKCVQWNGPISLSNRDQTRGAIRHWYEYQTKWTPCTLNLGISTLQFHSTVKLIPHTSTSPTLTPFQHHLILLPPLLFLLLLPQLPHMPTARIPIPNPLAPNSRFPTPWIPPLPNLSLTMKICAREIKGMHVAW